MKISEKYTAIFLVFVLVAFMSVKAMALPCFSLLANITGGKSNEQSYVALVKHLVVQKNQSGILEVILSSSTPINPLDQVGTSLTTIEFAIYKKAFDQIMEDKSGLDWENIKAQIQPLKDELVQVRKNRNLSEIETRPLLMPLFLQTLSLPSDVNWSQAATEKIGGVNYAFIEQNSTVKGKAGKLATAIVNLDDFSIKGVPSPSADSKTMAPRISYINGQTVIISGRQEWRAFDFKGQIIPEPLLDAQYLRQHKDHLIDLDHHASAITTSHGTFLVNPDSLKNRIDIYDLVKKTINSYSFQKETEVIGFPSGIELEGRSLVVFVESVSTLDPNVGEYFLTTLNLQTGKRISRIQFPGTRLILTGYTRPPLYISRGRLMSAIPSQDSLIIFDILRKSQRAVSLHDSQYYYIEGTSGVIDVPQLNGIHYGFITAKDTETFESFLFTFDLDSKKLISRVSCDGIVTNVRAFQFEGHVYALWGRVDGQITFVDPINRGIPQVSKITFSQKGTAGIIDIFPFATTYGANALVLRVSQPPFIVQLAGPVPK